MRTWKMSLLLLAVSVFLITAAACGNTVKSKDYGDEWPFLVSEVSVYCWSDWDRSAEPLLTVSVGDYFTLTAALSYLRANRPGSAG